MKDLDHQLVNIAESIMEPNDLWALNQVGENFDILLIVPDLIESINKKNHSFCGSCPLRSHLEAETILRSWSMSILSSSRPTVQFDRLKRFYWVRSMFWHFLLIFIEHRFSSIENSFFTPRCTWCPLVSSILLVDHFSEKISNKKLVHLRSFEELSD